MSNLIMIVPWWPSHVDNSLHLLDHVRRPMALRGSTRAREFVQNGITTSQLSLRQLSLTPRPPQTVRTLQARFDTQFCNGASRNLTSYRRCPVCNLATMPPPRNGKRSRTHAIRHSANSQTLQFSRDDDTTFSQLEAIPHLDSLCRSTVSHGGAPQSIKLKQLHGTQGCVDEQACKLGDCHE